MVQNETSLFNKFFTSEKSGGITLIICTVISLAIANSPLAEPYLSFWHQKAGVSLGTFALKLSVEHWVNDLLMAVFFLLIGLEIEREIYAGELSTLKNALLPIIAALGGLMLPAAIHLTLNYGTPFQAGAGIPMATDIAFAIAVISIVGNKAPISLKVFLTALAIIDDLGAILIIAIFYSGSISLVNLGIAAAIYGVLLIFNRMKIYSLAFYLIPGIAMWYFMLLSGIHATIAGVLLALAIPFGDGKETSPSYRLQHILHYPVAFFILPIFAMANTGIPIAAGWHENLLSSNSLGIILGLCLGKVVGITGASLLGKKIGIVAIPGEWSLRHLVGAGMLGGIGFTMSIFITLLAFQGSQEMIEQSKLAVMVASLLSGLTGYAILSRKATAKK